MNCQQFDQLVIRLACDQLSNPVAALAHAQSCASCGVRLARQRNIAAGLHVLAADEQRIQAPAHLGAALQSAFAQQMNAQPELRPYSLVDKLFAGLNWRFATAAALLLCAVVATGWLWRVRTAALPNQIAEYKAPVEPQDNTPHSMDTPKMAVLKSTVARPRRRVKPAPRQTEEYGELLSLTPLAQNEPDEFQQVVRMQIPRTTLQLWGVPLNEETHREQVLAEVLFSEDGVARAIRLRN